MAEEVQRPITQPAGTIQEVIADSTRALGRVRARLHVLDVVLLVLTALGGAALVVRAADDGFDTLRPWGYTAVVAGFLLSSVMAAPVLAVVLRLTRSDWRRPLTRISELGVVAGPVVLVLFVPLLLVIPSSEDRRTVWTIWTWGAPAFFDAMLLVLLVATGFAFLYVSSMPDFGIAHERVNGNRRPGIWYRRLARDWEGTLRQWRVLQIGVSLIGVLYVMLYIWSVSIIYADFGQTLVPGWRSAVFPAFAALSSLETGLAVIVVLMYVLRRWGGLEHYVNGDAFWSISKIQLTVALLWFYLWFSELMIFWYGRLPGEGEVLKLVMFDVYLVPMIIAFTCNFLAPLLILMWNRARKSIVGPLAVAILVLVGTFSDRLRIFGAAFSTEDPYAHELETLPAFLTPDLLDVLIVVGGLAGAVWLLWCGLRMVPIPSIWEVGGGLPLRVRKRYLNAEVTVIGKPD